MHILFLTDNFPPEQNAPATRTFEHAKYWVKWGHKVTVITCAPNFPNGKVYPGYKNKWQQQEIIDGINVIRVKTFMVANKGFFLRTIDYISFMLMAFFHGLFQKKIDVVVATSPQFFTAISGWMLAACKRKPFVFELRDLWPASIAAVGILKNKFLLKLLEKIELFLYHRAAAIVATTNAFKENLINRGIKSEKIYVALNGIDLENAIINKKDPKLVKKYSLGNQFIVGYIGTHGMAHALENVLHTAKLLNDEKNIKFIFVGAGAEREKLINIAQKNNLNNVIFIPQQPKEQIHLFWGLCNVALVHLKNKLTFATVIPSKIFEAMGMQTPIILAAPKGEASRLLENNSTGIWVNAEDPNKLKENIVKLYNDRELLDKFAENSKASIVKYSREKFAENMLDVLVTNFSKKTND